MATEDPETTRRARKPDEVTPTKAELTRARILHAAAFMFQEKGYAQTRLSDIARKAETQAGSIYYHFASREAIVAEVLEVANARTVECVRERLDRLPPDASVRERIEAAVQGHLGLVLSGDPFTRAHMRIFDQIPKQVRDHFVGVLDEYADVWRALFEDARKAGQFRSDIDPSVARLLLLGMLNWAVEWYRPGRLSVEQIGHQVTALFLDGISAPERE